MSTSTALLPADEISHGFDNITITDLSPTLLNRYVSAAQKISRLAVGRAPKTPRGDTFRIRPDVTQDSHLTGTPHRDARRHGHSTTSFRRPANMRFRSG